MLSYFFARAEGGIGLLTTGLIPVSHAAKLKEATKGPCELHTFPGADHAQSFLTDEARYLRILTAFLKTVETNQEVCNHE